MTDDKWAGTVAPDGTFHVLPWDDGGPADGHVVSIACDCGPRPVRDAPLDEPVWSHRAPTWPGATDEGRVS